jgi:predicted DNA binding CopG/RHH family protein
MGNLKQIPKFNNEAEEHKYWSEHDSTDFVDYSKAKSIIFPNLKPSTKTISIRLPESLLDRIKIAANKRDIPYQSLIKVYISEMLEKEHIH